MFLLMSRKHVDYKCNSQRTKQICTERVDEDRQRFLVLLTDQQRNDQNAIQSTQSSQFH